MILAAGYGTRMGVLSRCLPKPLLPLWNRSLLARHMDRLADWGVRDILVNVHHGADQMIREVISQRPAGCRLTLSFEPDILGTGGAIRKAQWFLDDHPFWLINADIVAILDPRPLLRAFCRERTIAALWMTAERGPRTVRVIDGRVTNFADPAPGTEGTRTFCGLHLLSKSILDWLPESGPASIIDAYVKAMRSGWHITATEIPYSLWIDAGTPNHYVEAHRMVAPYFMPRAPRADHSVAPTARVGRGAQLSRCVVMDQATIEPRAIVRDAIVGPRTKVRGRVTGLAVPAQPMLNRTQTNMLRQYGLHPETATLLEWPERGSARSFARIMDATRAVILMRYDPKRRENVYYTRQARFLLRCGWPVPSILGESRSECWALIEDLGDADLTSLIRPEIPNTSREYRSRKGKGVSAEWPLQNPSRSRKLYARILERVAELHGPLSDAIRDSRTPIMPPFDQTLYRYERALFTTHYLCGRLHINETRARPISRDLYRVAHPLQSAPRVLIHRDLQSSNIYWVDNDPAFIDFQGMRLGPAAYDLASLLCDPYVALPREMRDELLEQYRSLATPGDTFITEYRYACAQRLVQAIGAYARMGAIPGCERFLQHIPAALRLLNESLSDLDGLEALKEVVLNPP